MHMRNLRKVGYSRAARVSRNAISRPIGFLKIWILPCAMKNNSTRHSYGRCLRKSSPGQVQSAGDTERLAQQGLRVRLQIGKIAVSQIMAKTIGPIGKLL